MPFWGGDGGSGNGGGGDSGGGDGGGVILPALVCLGVHLQYNFIVSV